VRNDEETQWLRDGLWEWRQHLAARGFDVRPFVFEEPATLREIEELESRIGVGLPPSFRDVLGCISKHVEFRWFLPEHAEFPPPFTGNFSGNLHWSLDFTAELDDEKDSWLREVFPNVADAYHRVWHNKLAFYRVGNGGDFTIDLSRAGFEQIVYLSHDDGAGHGYVLADNFADLLRRWVPLACAGGEDWQWLPFTDGPASRLDPACKNALAWRRLLGIADRRAKSQGDVLDA